MPITFLILFHFLSFTASFWVGVQVLFVKLI
jgi:hypothetical protein